MIAGYIILLKVDLPGVRYFALVLVTAASGVAYPVLWPRRVQALRGTTGAALGIGERYNMTQRNHRVALINTVTAGLHNASAQLGGILGPQLFRCESI